MFFLYNNVLIRHADSTVVDHFIFRLLVKDSPEQISMFRLRAYKRIITVMKYRVFVLYYVCYAAICLTYIYIYIALFIGRTGCTVCNEVFQVDFVLLIY